MAERISSPYPSAFASPAIGGSKEDTVARDLARMSPMSPRMSDLVAAESTKTGGERSSKLCLDCAGKKKEKKEEKPKKEDIFYIIIAAHLANEKDWIGHATITLDVPTDDCKVATRITRGFWPRGVANFSDPALYTTGVPGTVMDDGAYHPGPEASHPLTASKQFKISCAQAKAALAVIRRREASPGLYTALTRQCTTFALEVLNAAGQNIDAGKPSRPGALYNTITGANLPAGSYSEPVRQLRDMGIEYGRDQAEQLRRRIEETMRKP
jgi:hypothetical protein